MLSYEKNDGGAISEASKMADSTSCWLAYVNNVRHQSCGQYAWHLLAASIFSKGDVVGEDNGKHTLDVGLGHMINV